MKMLSFMLIFTFMNLFKRLDIHFLASGNNQNSAVMYNGLEY